jgi:hypothetical protein
VRARTPYRDKGRRQDVLVGALVDALGRPPVLYEQRWNVESPRAQAWAKAQDLGPLFILAPASYHTVVADLGARRYIIVARAWTRDTRKKRGWLRVDLLPEIAHACAVARTFSMQETPLHKGRATQWSKTRWRIFLRTEEEIARFVPVLFSALRIDPNVVLLAGQRWRSDPCT